MLLVTFRCPTCSATTTKVAGNIVSIALILKCATFMFGNTKKLALLTVEKSTSPIKHDVIYPTITPINNGITFKNPLKSTLHKITVTNVTIDTITQVIFIVGELLPPTGNPAMSAALLANSKPIIVIIDPIAAGGNNLFIQPIPVYPTITAIKEKTIPVITKPPCIV